MPTFEEFQAALAAKKAEGLNHEDRVAMLSAGPPEAQGAPGFLETMGRETSEGLGAVSRMGDITNPSNLGANISGVLGAARAATAIPTALGAKAGQVTLDATGSPVAAGVADATASMGSSMLAGGAYGALGRAGRKAIPYAVPGASGAMLEQGMQEARALPAGFNPSVPSKDLYAVVDQMNPTILSLPNLKKTAEELATTEGQMAKFGAENSGLASQAGRIAATTGEMTEGVSFQETRTLLRRLGADIDQLRDPLHQVPGKSEKLAAAKKLYAATLTDLENSADEGVGPATEALKVANMAAKREFAVRELGDVIETGIKPLQGSQVPENVNFGTIMRSLNKEIAKNELFGQAFSKGEIDSIHSTLEELRKLPIGPASRGQPVGSSMQFRRAGVGSMLGGAIGGAIAGPPGAATGATLGAGAGLAFSNALASALMTDTGRRFITRIVKSQPNMLLTPQGLSLLNAVGRAGAAAQQPSE